MAIKGFSTNVTNKIDLIKDATKEINSQTETLDLSDDFFQEETLDLEGLSLEEPVNGSVISSPTEEDIQALVGSMNEEQYNQFVEGVENYYDQQATYLEGLLRSEDNKGYEDILSKVNTYIQRVEHDRILDPTDPHALDGLEEYGVTDYKSALEFQKEMQAIVDNTKESINMSKNLRDSAKYDYLSFLKDYDNYSSDIKVSDIEDINKYKEDIQENTPSAALAAQIVSFSYTEAKKDNPDITPLEFVKKIQEEYPNIDFTCDGIKNVEDLKNLAKASEYAPEMVSKYKYLYEQDPKKAEQYLKDIKYEINNIMGQIEAKEFLDMLEEAGDDEDKIDEIIYNELGVHLEGLYDGLDSFVMGMYHTGEAGYTGIQKLGKTLGIYNGEVYENRVMDQSEYKKMYILQALLSKENKEAAGLLNVDGTSTNPIIDFSKEYTGKFLSNNYEISQGIGNMIPSIALSYVNPALGSTVLGLSAGGNAYHGAMVEGNSYISSLMYGIYSGSSEAVTERMLGGLPGLSDVQVKGLKTYLKAMSKEGGQEIIQGIMDDVYQWSVMGKALPETAEEWAAWAKEKLKEGGYGAITAGYLNVPSLAINTISPTTPTNSTIVEPDVKETNDIPRVEKAETESIKAPTELTTDIKNDIDNSKKIINYDGEMDTEEISELATKLNIDINNPRIKNILKAITIGQTNSSKIKNDNIKFLVENLSSIFANMKVNITSYDMGSQFGGTQLNIDGKKALNSIRLTFMDFFHESGHAMHRLTPIENTQLSEDEIRTFNQARENYNLTPERKSILLDIKNSIKELEQKAAQGMLQIKAAEEARINELVDNMTSEQEDEIKGMLGKFSNYDIVQDELKKLGLKTEEINQIISDKETLKSILRRGNNFSNFLDIKSNLSADYNDYCVSRKLTSMLNSLLMTNKNINLGVEEFVFDFSHDDNYFDGLDSSYGELMADYFSIQTSGNQELIEKVRILLGDEIINILDNKYKAIADYMKAIINKPDNITTNSQDIPIIEQAETINPMLKDYIQYYKDNYISKELYDLGIKYNGNVPAEELIIDDFADFINKDVDNKLSFDAATVISDAGMENRYNTLYGHDETIISIYEKLTKKDGSKFLMTHHFDDAIAIRYLPLSEERANDVLATLEIPENVTPKQIEGLKKLSEQWKHGCENNNKLYFGIVSSVNADELSKVIGDTDRMGVPAENLDLLIDYLSKKTPTIEKAEDMNSSVFDSSIDKLLFNAEDITNVDKLKSPMSGSPLEINEDGDLYSKWDHGVYKLRDGYVVPKNYPEGFYYSREDQTPALKWVDNGGMDRFKPLRSPVSLSPLDFNEDGDLYSKWDHGVYKLRDGYVVPKNYPEGFYYSGKGPALKWVDNGGIDRFTELRSPVSLSPLDFNENGELYSKYDHRIYDISEVKLKTGENVPKEFIDKIHLEQEKAKIQKQQVINLYNRLKEDEKILYKNLNNSMISLKRENIIPTNYTFEELINLKETEKLFRKEYEDMYNLYHESGESFSDYLSRTSNIYKNISDYNSKLNQINKLSKDLNIKTGR